MAHLLDDYFADAGAHQLSLKSRTLYRLALPSIILPWAEREGIAEPAQLDQPAALNRLSVFLQTARRHPTGVRSQAAAARGGQALVSR